MWILLGCSLAGFALILERAIFWFYERKRLDLDELDQFFDSIHTNELDKAREQATQSDSEILNRLSVEWSERGKRALIESFDMAINRVEKRVFRYLYALKTIVSVSPLLGILGTVVGIIQSFQVLGAAGAAANPKAVGAGLAEALITTAFGLIIAVPCLIAHNYFRAKARNYISDLDEYAEELVFHVNGESRSEGSKQGPEEYHSSPSEESRESVA